MILIASSGDTVPSAHAATTAEVVEILKISARFQVPVIPFGAGTSLEGHVHAIRGGITVDLREMNRVLRIGTEDLDATVQAGIAAVRALLTD